MNDYLLLMHSDAPARTTSEPPLEWEPYLANLRQSGNFSGGSSIGDGVCIRKGGSAREITVHLSGFIRVRAESIDAAKKLVFGNPVFEAGGTVEIRELPRT